jgi:hypothetical protein
MQKRSYFPYRRPGGKKPRPNRNRDGRPPANSPRHLLSVMPSATKALAHVLAGKTKRSGQLRQAEIALEQAEKFIGEGAVERLPPREREEFLEQFARLKLILDDAAIEMQAEAAERAAPPPPAAPPVGQERLREIAFALAGGATLPQVEPDPPPAPPAEPEPEAVETAPETKRKMARSRRSGDRSERLTIGAGDRENAAGAGETDA